MIEEAYRGIRPAPGYPACPEHTVKIDMFRQMAVRGNRHAADRILRHVPRRLGLRLLLRHPQSKYFIVGKIGDDQVADMAARRGVPQDEVERWLAPNL